MLWPVSSCSILLLASRRINGFGRSFCAPLMEERFKGGGRATGYLSCGCRYLLWGLLKAWQEGGICMELFRIIPCISVLVSIWICGDKTANSVHFWWDNLAMVQIISCPPSSIGHGSDMTLHSVWSSVEHFVYCQVCTVLMFTVWFDFHCFFLSSVVHCGRLMFCGLRGLILRVATHMLGLSGKSHAYFGMHLGVSSFQDRKGT